jgi:Rrf2 family protein
VDLTLSSRGDYVLRAALALAWAWDGEGRYRKIRQVAQEMDLPVSYTPQVLAALARAGIAEAKAGREGGYRLRKEPAEISVLEVIEAGEGDLVSRRCPLRGGPCRWDDACAFHPAWVNAGDAMRERLATATLADVLAEDRRLADTDPSRPRSRRRSTRPRDAATV